MRAKRYFLNGLLLLLLPGCGTLSRDRAVTATQEVPQNLPSTDELHVGHIAFVRGMQKPPFVLISLERGVNLPDGARLQASTKDGSITVLKTTTQRSDGYQVANIVSGSPRLGDKVVLRYPKGDGTDVTEADLDEIPPLIRPQAQAETASSSSPPEDSPPPASLRRPRLKPLDELDEEEASLPPVNVFSPPATRDDVEPRAPIREATLPELPTLEPDEGDDFILELPQR